MLIIPAIDIIDGKCVRLYKGDYDHQKTYHKSPALQAIEFERDGADMIHIVDLEGAKEGEIVNKKSIQEIRNAVDIPIEVGGGIRNKESVKELLDIGVDRVILGTSLIEQPDLVHEMIKEFGVDTIVVGLDARHGMLAIKGWKEKTEVDAIDFAEKLHEKGVKWIIFTDIYRDGTLTLPAYDEYEKLVQLLPKAKIIASGGVSQAKQLDTLREIGVTGAIIGKALYEGKITLSEVTGSK